MTPSSSPSIRLLGTPSAASFPWQADWDAVLLETRPPAGARLAWLVEAGGGAAGPLQHLLSPHASRFERSLQSFYGTLELKLSLCLCICLEVKPRTEIVLGPHGRPVDRLALQSLIRLLAEPGL